MLWREVPNVTNINSGVLPAVQWPLRPGASSLRVSFPGTGVSAVGSGTGPCAPAARPAPRVRDKAALTVPAMHLGQTNIYNSMTSVVAVGEGASGPPPYRESA
jgi:hypothetical protein